MHIYAIISIVLFLAFCIEQKTNSMLLKNRLFYLGSLLVVGQLAFRSDNIGMDTLLYCQFFDGSGSRYGVVGKIDDGIEVGFQLVSWILSLVSSSHFWFIFSTSLLLMLPFLFIINRDCRNSRILPLFLYMNIWTLLIVSQTAFRQNMSVSFLMFAYIVFTAKSVDESKQKFTRYLSIVLLVLAYFVHKSVAIAVCLAFVAYFIKWNKKYSIIALLVSLVVTMRLNNLFAVLFAFFSLYLGDIDATSRMIDLYYDNEQYSLYGETTFNALGPVTLLTCLLVYMSDEEDRKSFFFKMLMMGTITYNIGASFPLMARTLFGILMFAIMFTPSRLKENRIAYIVLLLLCMFFIRNEIVYWQPNPDTHFLPYTFFWE